MTAGVAGGALRVVESAAWLDQVLEDFERDMLRRDLTPNTVRIYRASIEDLFAAMRAAGMTEITQLTRDLLERWQDALLARRNSASTRSVKVNAVRQLLWWAADHDLVDLRLTRSLAKVKVKQKEPRPIPEADLELLLALLLPRRPHMDIVSLRDRALFVYLVTSTARVSEVLQMQRDEIDEPVVRQKGGYEKTLRVPAAAREYLDDYLRARADTCPWVWISHRTNTPLDRITPPGVLKIWKKLARKLGIKPFTTHQLRHTGLTELLENDVPQLVIADQAGHHGVRTLHRYAQVRGRQRERVMEVMENLVHMPAEPRRFVAFRRPRRRRPTSD